MIQIQEIIILQLLLIENIKIINNLKRIIISIVDNIKNLKQRKKGI